MCTCQQTVAVQTHTHPGICQNTWTQRALNQQLVAASLLPLWLKVKPTSFAGKGHPHKASQHSAMTGVQEVPTNSQLLQLSYEGSQDDGVSH